MPIQTSCEGCSQQLRVADAHAGKLARCPSCNLIYRVPVPDGVTPAPAKPKPTSQSQSASPLAASRLGPLPLDVGGDPAATDSSAVTPAPTAWPPPPAEEQPSARWDPNRAVNNTQNPGINPSSPATPSHNSASEENPSPTYYRPQEHRNSHRRATAPRVEPLWRMRTPEGQVYGPVPLVELDMWVREGRVSGDCQLRENDGSWFWANQMYSHLAASPASGQSTTSTTAAVSNLGSGIVGRQSRRLANDRGATILALGIMGWIVICPFISLAAWMMGGHDLREMNQGRMVRTNIGMTQVGRALGMLHVLLAGAFLVFLFFAANM